MKIEPNFLTASRYFITDASLIEISSRPRARHIAAKRRCTGERKRLTLLLTLQAVGVQEVLALLVTLDTALHTSHPLPSDAPEQTLALVAVGRRRGSPGDEIVRGGRGDRVDHRLQGFLVHVHLLRVYDRTIASPLKIALKVCFVVEEETGDLAETRECVFAQTNTRSILFLSISRFSARES